MKRINADKDSVLDYSNNWSSWLGIEELVSVSTWVCASDNPENVIFGQTGITDTDGQEDTVPKTDAFTYTFISFDGAEAGDEYTLTNHIKTNHNPPREEDQSVVLVIVEN